MLCTSLCAALFITGCDKNDDEDEARLMIVNASPNGGSVDAAVNGTAFANNIMYPGNSGYKEVRTGNINITVTPSGSTTKIIDGTLATEANASYTLYVVDSSHERRGSITRDDLTAPGAGKAKVRLLHLSPNSPAVDITSSGSGTFTSSNRSFNDVSWNSSFASFTEVNAGAITLQAKAAGTSTVLVTFPVLNLEAGGIYTIMVKGFLGGSAAQALGLELMRHN